MPTKKARRADGEKVDFERLLSSRDMPPGIDAEQSENLLRDFGIELLKGLQRFVAEAESESIQISPPSASYFAGVFGESTKSHAFNNPFNWGINLTEPNITEALANLLELGPPKMRRERLRAFLKALGVNIEISENALDRCQVDAEIPFDQGRIDLRVLVPKGGVYVPIIIEAKFKHKLTKGQLKNYYEATQKEFSKTAKAGTYILLAETEAVKEGLAEKEEEIWRYVGWTEFWLRFEEQRPEEDDPGISLFMNALWQKIQFT